MWNKGTILRRKIYFILRNESHKSVEDKKRAKKMLCDARALRSHLFSGKRWRINNSEIVSAQI